MKNYISSDPEHKHDVPNHSHTPTWHVWATGWGCIFIFLNTQFIFSFVSVEDINRPTLSFILANFLSFHMTGLLIIVVFVSRCVPAGQRLIEMGLNWGFSRSLFIYSLKMTLLIIPALAILNLGILNLLEKLNWPTSNDPMIHWIFTAPPHLLILLVFGAVVIAPVAEEVMFRLVLHKTFHQYLGRNIANVLTSLVFAVFHLKPEQILPLFILALILQRSFNRTQNIFLPISIHSLFNGAMIMLALMARFFYRADA